MTVVKDIAILLVINSAVCGVWFALHPSRWEVFVLGLVFMVVGVSLGVNDGKNKKKP